MPVLVFYAGVDVDQQAYEAVKDDVGWEAEPPPGALLHLAGFDETDRTFEVTVWESEEAYGKYWSTRLLPALRRAGLELPAPVVTPMHIGAISSLALPHLTLVETGRALSPA